jgi:phospholipase D1/2
MAITINYVNISQRIILDYQYKSLCRGGFSIFDELRKIGIEPDDYIGIYSLRNWGSLSKEGRERFLTEEIYIHSKVMIVDDRYGT